MDLSSNHHASLLLGHLCNDPTLITNKAYPLKLNDFDSRIHKIVYGTIENVIKKSEQDLKEVNELIIDTYLSTMPKQYAYFEANDGIEYIRKIKQLAKKNSFKITYETVKKYSLLRDIRDKGIDVSDIIYDNPLDIEGTQAKMEEFEAMTLSDILGRYNEKILDLKADWQNLTNTQVSYDVSEGLDELLEELQTVPQYGLATYSKYMNRVTRGKQRGKMLLRSGNSGTGKTRSMIADAVMDSCVEQYDTSNGKWIENKIVEPTSFISTELTVKEVQTCLIATIARIPEETVKNGKWSPEEKERILRSIKIIKQSPLFVDYIDDFTIDDIENIIERNILKNHVSIVYFDYIQICASLAADFTKKFKMALREDQMLSYLATMLKAIAVKYDIYLCSGTQLNSSYKQDDEPDTTYLAGGKATANKVDQCVIMLRLDNMRRKKLDKILTLREEQAKREFKEYIEPNMGYYVCKNRGGAWNYVVVWVYKNLDTMECTDLFVTDYQYRLLDMKPLDLKKG